MMTKPMAEVFNTAGLFAANHCEQENDLLNPV